MNAKKYIREIIERSCLPNEERKKIKADLENEIYYAMERGESIEQIIERLGEPDEIAAGLYENFINTPARPFREYKSKSTLFGLPIIHIVSTSGARASNAGRRNNTSYLYKLPAARGVFAFGPKANGIVAIGNISKGFISFGNISMGIISIGNISAGLLSLGNISLALFISLGNAVVGALSAGNAAFGYAAIGNAAFGKYAVGNGVWGEFTLRISNLASQLGLIKDYFAWLKAPAPVKVFFEIIEKTLEILNGPTAQTALIIILTIILTISLVLIIVPYKLLKRTQQRG